MKRLALITLMALARCAPMPSKPPDLATAIGQLTQKDLQTTIDIASSVTPPDTMAIMCATYLQLSLASLQSGKGFITPTGAASTLETARLGYRAALGGISPQQHDQIIVNCGPLAISVANDVAQGALTLSNAGGFQKFLMGLIPMVAVLPQL